MQQRYNSSLSWPFASSSSPWSMSDSSSPSPQFQHFLHLLYPLEDFPRHPGKERQGLPEAVDSKLHWFVLSSHWTSWYFNYGNWPSPLCCQAGKDTLAIAQSLKKFSLNVMFSFCCLHVYTSMLQTESWYGWWSHHFGYSQQQCKIGPPPPSSNLSSWLIAWFGKTLKTVTNKMLQGWVL